MIHNVKGEVLLADLVILLRALDEDMDKNIKVGLEIIVINLFFQVKILLEQFANNGSLILSMFSCCVSETACVSEITKYFRTSLKKFWMLAGTGLLP